jgi:hypothetical protein
MPLRGLEEMPPGAYGGPYLHAGHRVAGVGHPRTDAIACVTRVPTQAPVNDQGAGGQT